MRSSQAKPRAELRFDRHQAVREAERSGHALHSMPNFPGVPMTTDPDRRPSPQPPTFRLGTGASLRSRTDQLRGGEVAFESARGLRRETALLIEALPRKAPQRALFGLDTEGAVAITARAIWPQAELAWFHVDAYVGAKVAGVLGRCDAGDVQVVVAEDPPEGPFGIVALPFPRNSEALLMRDLVESAHDRLAKGGRLVAATDGGPDALERTLDKVFGNATPAAPRGIRGACFYAERRREKPSQSDHSHVVRATIAHGDGSGVTSLDLETRPGIFSHGAIDRGTRALAEWLQPRGAEHVLDLGCGSGTLGLYAAKRLPEARVVLVDSNARAAGCARRNAERNGVADRVEVLVRADVEDVPVPARGGYSLCMTNPPYFSQWRIATQFVRRAHALLRRGGRFALVVREGKAAEEHASIVREVFGGGAVDLREGYAIVHASR
jgi:16S rRNA G1207 methylase RsmC